MPEKRYYAHKHLLQENQVHDKICHNFMNIDETVEHMNNEYWKYKQLKEENEQLKKKMEINNEIVKIIKKHLPIGFVAGLEDKQIENTVKSILKELKEEELLK